ncbi:hypothetical protein DPMN_173275 [Dreissena polymorpha]|uniref:Uncharacterized protein n=2 Tax=Dreissena polymorpha TaxID=45954 RepID=A0A9D4E2D9_DREPO|nr:hypothetical protein DPMN_173275 [Dreissena polymorpha]
MPSTAELHIPESIASLNGPAVTKQIPLCEFYIWENSKFYFQSRLRQLDPKFVKFRIQFADNFVVEKCEPQVLKPHIWFFTSSTATTKYPYLFWNLDFGLLTFDLLDTKTLEIPFVDLRSRSTSRCLVDFGANYSMINIANALAELVDNETVNGVHVFEEIYFCYLTEMKGATSRLGYYAGLYLNYPTPSLKYSCCVITYDYVLSEYSEPVCDTLQEKWTLCTIGPYIVGVSLLMYIPILVLDLLHCLGTDEIIKSFDHDSLSELCSFSNNEHDRKWVYLDGKSPMTLSHLPAQSMTRFKTAHPVLFSRLRRFLCMFFTPVILYIKLFMYRNGMGVNNKITVDDLVRRGNPLGFLSVLANSTDAREVFVPILGCPTGAMILYVCIGIVLLVLPRSLKQVIENGTPKERPWSPFFLGLDEILCMAQIEQVTEPGYHRAAAVCRGSFYMMFTKSFWHKLFYMQQKRIQRLKRSTGCLFFVVLPFVAFLCLMEIVLCVVYNLIPLINITGIIIKGAVLTKMAQRRYYKWLSCICPTPLFLFCVLICVVL